MITPRPGADVRFSTNFFHGTWHVLSDWRGAHLLGHLLWGLAYQRVPGTLVLIDRPFLDPNPFDAAPADPVALVPARLTALSAKAARELRHRLPLANRPPDGTVRWHTPGLDAAVAERRTRRSRPATAPYASPPRGFQDRVDRVGGLITLTAVPDALRTLATDTRTMTDHAYAGMSYTEVDWPHGEVQVFRDYRARVSAARVARREVRAEQPDAPDELIWQRTDQARRRRFTTRRA